MLAAAAVPPLAVLALIATHARNLPYWDHWGMVEFIVKATTGALRSSDLLEQLNEHRIIIPRMVMGGLAFLTKWDVRWELIVDFIVALATFACLAGLIIRTVRPHAPALVPWLILVASLQTFSLAQGFGWTWGMQMPHYMSSLGAAASAWALSRWNGRWTETMLLLACSIWGALSCAAGLVLLGLVPLALLCMPAEITLRRRILHVLMTSVIAAVFIALYFKGWYPAIGQPKPVFAWSDTPQIARYFLAYHGGPFGPPTPPVAAWWGGAALATYVACTIWLWRRYPVYRRLVSTWSLLAAYVTANGVLTTYGRFGAGLQTATIRRYLPAQSLFAVAVTAVVAVAVRHLLTRRPRLGMIAAAAVGLALLGILRSSVPWWRSGIQIIRNHDRQMAVASLCLHHCATTTDACFSLICWDPKVARRFCPMIEEHRLGPFATSGG